MQEFGRMISLSSCCLRFSRRRSLIQGPCPSLPAPPLFLRRSTFRHRQCHIECRCAAVPCHVSSSSLCLRVRYEYFRSTMVVAPSRRNHMLRGLSLLSISIRRAESLSFAPSVWQTANVLRYFVGGGPLYEKRGDLALG